MMRRISTAFLHKRADFGSFIELRGHLQSLNSEASWYYIANQTFSPTDVDTRFFKEHYDTAMGINEATKKVDPPNPNKLAATREVLRDAYMRLPFEDMYREDYNWHVRAPE